MIKNLVMPGMFLAVVAAQGGELVRGEGYAVPEKWGLRNVMGRDYWIRLRMFAGDLVNNPSEKAFRDLSFFKEAAWALPCYRKAGVSDLKSGGVTNGVKDYAVLRAKDEVFKGKYRLADFVAPKLAPYVLGDGAKGRPFFLEIDEARPAYLLGGGAEADTADYADWAAAHPNFQGFCVMAEFDSDSLWYTLAHGREQKWTFLDPVAEWTVGRRFPYPGDRFGWYWNIAKAFEVERDFHFGERRLWTMGSGCLSLSHYGASVGARGLGYEAALNSSSGPWTFGATFTRGAQRQFGIPFFTWYMANHYGYAKDRHGNKSPSGHIMHPYKANEGYFKSHGMVPLTGAGRSLLRRQYLYGFLAGATYAEPEGWGLCFKADAADGTTCPSPYALDFEAVYELTKRIDRGVPYTPIAFVVPVGERFDRGGNAPFADDLWVGGGRDKKNRDVISQTAFFYTLCPLSDPGEKPFLTMRARGNQGCLYNSAVGDVWDVVMSGAGQSYRQFAEALSPYKAAFVVGSYHQHELFTSSLVDYVEVGGTLFVDAGRLLDGEFPARMAGIDFFEGKSVKAEGGLLAPDGTKLGTFDEEYEIYLPTSGEGVRPTAARPYLRDSKGTVIAWTHDVGKGRVVTVACRKMQPKHATLLTDFNAEFPKVRARLDDILARRVRFPIIDALVRAAQAEALPVSVDGDCQFGVNVTKKGLLVWLYNNRGVTKFNLEEEQIDRSLDAAVTIAPKVAGTCRDAETGAPLACADGKVTVKVPAGGWRLVSIER